MRIAGPEGILRRRRVTAGFAAQKRLQLELVYFEPKFENAKGLLVETRNFLAWLYREVQALDGLMLTADCGRYRCFGQVGKLR